MVAKRSVLGLVVGCVMLASLGCASDGRRARINDCGCASAEAPANDVAVLWISDLSCGPCVYGLKLKIQSLDGVQDVYIDRDAGEIHAMVSARHATAAEFESAVVAAGFSLGYIDMPGGQVN